MFLMDDNWIMPFVGGWIPTLYSPHLGMKTGFGEGKHKVRLYKTICPQTCNGLGEFLRTTVITSKLDQKPFTILLHEESYVCEVQNS